MIVKVHPLLTPSTLSTNDVKTKIFGDKISGGIDTKIEEFWIHQKMGWRNVVLNKAFLQTFAFDDFCKQQE